jgi:hypothetical protein
MHTEAEVAGLIRQVRLSGGARLPEGILGAL